MRTAILISSCDAFIDCWEPMIYSIKKSWPDCRYPIYLISNDKEINDSSVTFLKVGEDLGFASNLKKALKMIDYDYIIYFQDDYFIDNKVNSSSIEAHINHCKKNDIDFLKLSDESKLRDKLKINNSIYCRNPIDVKYSLNTEISIWKKDMLEKICVDGFTGWDFERKIISYILRNGIKINSETIYSSFYPQEGIKTVLGTAVRRGRWTKDGVKFLKENGFKEIIYKRKTESNLTTYLMSVYAQNSFLRIPVSIIIKILQKLNF